MSSEFETWSKLIGGEVIRGEDAELTDDLAARLALAFARMLAEKSGTTSDDMKIAVGQDGRGSGERLRKAVIRGLKAADSDVLDCGVCTTPAVYMACVLPVTRADGAIMVTAGRHGEGMNGFKFFTRSGSLSTAEVEKLVERAGSCRLVDPLVTRVDILSAYAQHLKTLVRERLDDASLKPLLGLKLVVDAGNGAGVFYADLLKELGAETISCPTETVGQTVCARGADLGVTFDMDGDRATVFGHDGRAIDGNRLIALTAAILLEEHPGATIVTDSVTSSGLNRFITEWGGVHYRYRRGHMNVIAEAVRLNGEEIDCPLAIETSGHAALRANHFLDDGTYLVTLLVCEALRRKREGQTLSSLIDELQEPVETVELRLPIRAKDFRAAGQAVIERVLSHTLNNPAWELAPDNREGVRINFNMDGGVRNAWIMLRISVNDPVMPLNAESDVPGGVDRMLRALRELLGDARELDVGQLDRATGKGMGQ